MSPGASPRQHHQAELLRHHSPVPAPGGGVGVGGGSFETPLNLSKPRGYMGMNFPFHPMGPSGLPKPAISAEMPMTVQPPPAHSNHPRTMMNHTVPRPDLSEVIKGAGFQIPQQFLANPFAALSPGTAVHGPPMVSIATSSMGSSPSLENSVQYVQSSLTDKVID